MAVLAYLKTVLALSLGGTLFAGYLSGVKLFTGTCAFNETCPYFLGYPSCWYGFGMFLAMTLVAAAALAKKLDAAKAAKAIAGVSFAGILFAGYFVVGEIIGWLSVPAATRYGLVLPTCVYGLVFYVIIFGLSARRAFAQKA
jgi:hypothetical protein